MNYYNEIKNKFINNEVYKRAKYGDNLIREYSERLTRELGKKYSTRFLKYMRNFYLFQKGQPVAAQLTLSYYIELLSLKDNEKVNALRSQLTWTHYRLLLSFVGDWTKSIVKEI